MKGRAWLFSAAMAVLTRPPLVEGVKAEADPARRVAAKAMYLTILNKLFIRY